MPVLLVACLLFHEGRGEENRGLAVVSPAVEASESSVPALYHATPDELELWIDQLGSPQFRIRENATLRLSGCDSSALEALRKKGNESTDEEVKSRCFAIAQAIYELDIGKRKNEFVKSADTQKTFGFEGWVPFSKIVGETRASKRLFSELIDVYPWLAQKSFDDSAELAPLLRNISEEVFVKFRTGMNLELGDSVAILYCSIRLKGEVPPEMLRTTLLLLRQIPFTNEIRREPLRSALRKLVGQWMLVARDELSFVLRVAVENDIPESIHAARKVLEDSECEPLLFYVAIAALTRYGKEEDLVLLAKWREKTRLMLPPFELEIRTPVPIPEANEDLPDVDQGPRYLPASERRTFELRYQDLALAASMKLAGREDIRLFFPRVRMHPYFVFSMESLAFPQGETEGRQKVLELFKSE